MESEAEVGREIEDAWQYGSMVKLGKPNANDVEQLEP